MLNEGAWIFLSHSHKDFDRVRLLRDELESVGHHPLMFFLKCLNDDSELDDLIRREIEAREWFLLCDSENSRASRWVQNEVQIIASNPDKAYAVVDLSAEFRTQVKQASVLAKRASVFLSYRRTDETVAYQMAKTLREHDYGMLGFDTSIAPEVTIGERIVDEIQEASEHGFVLVLIGSKSLESLWVREEIRTAFRYGSENVIPIVLPGVDRLLLEHDMEEIFQGVAAVDFRRGSIKENMELLIAGLKKRRMN